MIRKNVNSQQKQGDINSSFTSTNERPLNVPSEIAKEERLGMGYHSFTSTPMPPHSKTLSSSQKPGNNKSIIGKAGSLSVYKQKPKDEEGKNFLMSDKAVKENHLLRSIQKLKQQDDKSASTRIGVGGKNENFNRMAIQLNATRKAFGARVINNRPNSKEQKMINQMYSN